jgi:hypothetical protein
LFPLTGTERESLQQASYARIAMRKDWAMQ